jgi:phosphoglycolate phosphatase-like HAD superfamily hydrolase
MDRMLVLWDIDGTLVRSGGVSGEALDAAVEDVVGSQGRPWIVERRGRTDHLILTELLTRAGVPASDRRRLMPIVLARAEELLRARANEISAEGWMCAGVEAVLEKVSRLDHISQSVLTGNSQANARTKLAAFGLERFFDLDIGAFGDCHSDRTELLGHALHLCLSRYGHDYEGTQIWIVGDTPHDLACARSGGARCLLVATGQYSYEELERVGPDAVLLNLLDTTRVVELLRQ